MDRAPGREGGTGEQDVRVRKYAYHQCSKCEGLREFRKYKVGPNRKGWFCRSCHAWGGAQLPQGVRIHTEEVEA